jgi:hypothetical protein
MGQTMNRRDLRATVKNFRDGILDGREPDMMCFAVCAPLEGYLAFFGLVVELIEGSFGSAPHCWLELEDGTVIDPTASQFNSEICQMPAIYIGPKTHHYRVEPDA